MSGFRQIWQKCGGRNLRPNAPRSRLWEFLASTNAVLCDYAYADQCTAAEQDKIKSKHTRRKLNCEPITCCNVNAARVNRARVKIFNFAQTNISRAPNILIVIVYRAIAILFGRMCALLARLKSIAIVLTHPAGPSHI